PHYPQTPLEAEEMTPVRDALDTILAGHRPFPALVVDRHWNLVTANEPALDLLTEGVAGHLLAPPAHALRVSLHPEGLAPRIVNLGEWAAHLVDRLRREADLYGDRELEALHDELISYPGVAGSADPGGVAERLFVPMVLDSSAGRLSFF